MDVIKELYNCVSKIVNIPFDLFGFNITFMNIIAFVIVGTVSGIVLTKLIRLFSF